MFVVVDVVNDFGCYVRRGVVRRKRFFGRVVRYREMFSEVEVS